MLLGIPRGFFYYDYISFVNQLFGNTDIEIVVGMENNEKILEEGSRLSVNEACFPVKLFVGQVNDLCSKCHKVLILRIMKDYAGGWLCPKLLGVPELSLQIRQSEKLLVSKPIYFDNKSKARKALWQICRALKMEKRTFECNFEKAYDRQMKTVLGMKNTHIEAGWEFIPPAPRYGEIVLPNTKKVLLLGHCYSVYDKFANGNIMKKLDDLSIDTVTGREVTYSRREETVKRLNLPKKPFWEAFTRILGLAVELKDKVDGIIYLSSFSCGIDSFVYEMIKKYASNVPVMILKLDEHRGEAGVETRLEAFADLLEKRRPV